VKQIDVPQITTIEKYVEVPHVQTVEKIVEVPMVGDGIQGQQNHQHAHLPVQREVHPAEVFHETHIGPAFDVHYAGVQNQVTYAAPQEVTYGAPPMMEQVTYGAPTEGEQMFDQLDRNHDGVLDRQEFDAAMQQVQQ